MAEELTGALVLEQLQKLFVAFPTHAGMKSNPRGTADLYRESMHGLSGEAFRAAVRVAIDTGKFFPKVAELRETAWEWTRRHRVEIEPVYGDPLYCPRCNAHATWQSRWRPKFDDHGYAILSEDRQYVALERYLRLLCNCASPSLYAPEEDQEHAWMLANKIKWSFGRHRNPRPSERWRAPLKEIATALGDVTETVLEEALVHA